MGVAELHWVWEESLELRWDTCEYDLESCWSRAWVRIQCTVLARWRRFTTKSVMKMGELQTCLPMNHIKLKVEDFYSSKGTHATHGIIVFVWLGRVFCTGLDLSTSTKSG